MTDGQKSVQSSHAAINFCFEYRNKASPWWQDSNYLVLLEVENEKELGKLIDKCKMNLLDVSIFREPDLGNVITAIAIEPSEITQKLCRKIPLLFKTKTNESI